MEHRPQPGYREHRIGNVRYYVQGGVRWERVLAWGVPLVVFWGGALALFVLWWTS